MLAVFDTNVIVSGLLFKGSTKDLFTFVDSGKITLCFTPNIFAEIQRVLTYTHLQPALKKNLISQEEMMDFLRDHSELFEDVSVFNLVKDDSTDNKFIDCAFRAGARWVVSGDHHLLDLGTVGDIRIVTPAQF